jgi:hypothetical protein
MKKLFLILLIAAGCQTVKVKDKTFKTSNATVELGSIGMDKSRYNTNNDFTIQAIPVLQNPVRLDVQVLPFTSDINKIYVEKRTKTAGKDFTITYNDSLATKPYYTLFSIMDTNAYASEINAAYNKSTFTYLTDTEDAVTITGIAYAMPPEVIDQIRQADAYYLINSQEKKYTVALYKDGKKNGVIDLNSGLSLAYTLGKFCWAENDRLQWHVADIVEDNKGCKGNTRSRIQEKEQKSLFKM